ncbi:MAG: hypothetical protein GY846_26410 [Deltaproteobacteria bacterium]|nr:hypothetical protein [Deltaproteobacteria bacterium]
MERKADLISPSFTTPNLDTPSAGTLTNATGLPLATGVTGTLPVANGGTGETTASAAFSALKQAATDSATGVVELATTGESQTGTDTGRAVTPDGLTAAVREQSWSQDDSLYIAVDEIRARDSGGLKLYDDSGSNGIFVEDGGNVGIGTASPSQKMVVANSSGLSVFTSWQNSDTGYLSTDGFSFGLDSNEDANLWHRENKNLILATSNAERIRIDSSGNVGIGTTSPDANLQVESSTASKIYITGGTVNEAAIYLGDSDAAHRGYIGYANSSDSLVFQTSAVSRITIDSTGNVGIGTTAPGNPLAVNRSADGVIVDFESADIVEGTVSISGNTTSYNAFVGSHYTQLKDGQAELPVGAVVVSTGEIIPCRMSKEKLIEATEKDAITVVPKDKAIVMVDVSVEDKTTLSKETITYAYDPKTNTETPQTQTEYGTKIVPEKQYAEGVKWDSINRRFYKLNAGYIEKDGQFFRESTEIKTYTGKEYFVYVDTTTTASDKRVYGVMLGKMSDNAAGMSFGDDAKPVYLIAQVGLFKIRVTDTNGNIENGDYLETSTRVMEAQKQTSGAKLNSTIAKAMIDVDWGNVTVDGKLGYKWQLIPCTF